MHWVMSSLVGQKRVKYSGGVHLSLQDPAFCKVNKHASEEEVVQTYLWTVVDNDVFTSRYDMVDLYDENTLLPRDCERYLVVVTGIVPKR